MKINTFLFVCLAFVLTSILLSSCENSPFDPRTKYLKEWTMEFEITEDYPSNKDTIYSQVSSITKMENEESVATGWGIYIDSYGCSIDRKGNIYSLLGTRNEGGNVIGEISRKEFTFTTNTSVNGPGAIVTIHGKKL
jgi:hypothetical protein